MTLPIAAKIVPGGPGIFVADTDGIQVGASGGALSAVLGDGPLIAELHAGATGLATSGFVTDVAVANSADVGWVFRVGAATGLFSGALLRAGPRTVDGVAFSVTEAGILLVTGDGTNKDYQVFKIGSLSTIQAAVQAAGAGSLIVEDEGAAVGVAALRLNFSGAGVTASGDGAVKTITIPGDDPNAGHAIEALQDVTSDMHAGVTSTGWADATASAQGGITHGSSSFTEAALRALSASAFGLSAGSEVGGRWVAARIPAADDPRQVRILFRGRHAEDSPTAITLSNFAATGESSDGAWKYYGFSRSAFGTGVASATLQVTGDAARLGTSRFRGIVDGTLTDGLVEESALDPTVAGRLLDAGGVSGDLFHHTVGWQPDFNAEAIARIGPVVKDLLRGPTAAAGAKSTVVGTAAVTLATAVTGLDLTAATWSAELDRPNSGSWPAGRRFLAVRLLATEKIEDWEVLIRRDGGATTHAPTPFGQLLLFTETSPETGFIYRELRIGGTGLLDNVVSVELWKRATPTTFVGSLGSARDALLTDDITIIPDGEALPALADFPAAKVIFWRGGLYHKVTVAEDDAATFRSGSRTLGSTSSFGMVTGAYGQWLLNPSNRYHQLSQTAGRAATLSIKDTDYIAAKGSALADSDELSVTVTTDEDTPRAATATFSYETTTRGTDGINRYLFIANASNGVGAFDGVLDATSVGHVIAVDLTRNSQPFLRVPRSHEEWVARELVQTQRARNDLDEKIEGLISLVANEAAYDAISSPDLATLYLW